MKSYLSEQQKTLNQTSNINYNASFRLRSHFGLGGFFEYKLSENLFVAAEPVVVLTSDKILINYLENGVVNGQNGSLYRVSSEARIKRTYISLPLIAKFRFNHRKELFVFGGGAVNFNFTPHLKSTEKQSTIVYSDGISSNYSNSTRQETLKLNSYSKLSVNAVIGIGKVFNPFGRNIIVDLRFNYPLTRSSLYAKGVQNYSLAGNALFTQAGVSAASKEGFALNDFKTGTICLSVCYTLYKNYR